MRSLTSRVAVVRRAKPLVRAELQPLSARHPLRERFAAQLMRALADVFRDLRRYAEAVDHQERALDIALEVGERRAAGLSLDGLGETHLATGEGAVAESRFTAAVALFAEVHDEHNLAIAKDHLAAAFDALRRPGDARAARERAYGLFTRIGDPRAQAVRRRLDEDDDAAAGAVERAGTVEV